MEGILNVVTIVMVALGDAVFAVLGVMPTVIGFWVLCQLLGIAMLLIWRYTSNQDAIGAARDKITANLLATRLFKDNLAVTFRAQRQILWQSGKVLGYSIKPTLIMLVPFVLAMVQVGLRYEHRPASVGETVRVQATVKDGVDITDQSLRLELPAGVKMAAMPCRIEALRTIDWRLMPEQAGVLKLRLDGGDSGVEMPLHVDNGFTRIGSRRGGGFWDRLLYSDQPGIPASCAFDKIQVFYPTRSTPIFGVDVHWLISLLVLSIIFAFIYKPLLNVRI
ncbi:MAG: hypothetical protein JXO22_11050 [Phycisphaerae bacterium]|nr:hypothetical protein [Phycisphaerae bacterium]